MTSRQFFAFYMRAWRARLCRRYRPNARTALDMVRRHTADLVVLDLGLPDMDGLDVVRQIRDGGETLPIICRIVRTKAPRSQRSILAPMTMSRKPFGIDELLARIRTAQRHRLQQEGERPLFQAGDLSVDLVRRIVTVRGSEVKTYATRI